MSTATTSIIKTIGVALTGLLIASGIAVAAPVGEAQAAATIKVPDQKLLMCMNTALKQQYKYPSSRKLTAPLTTVDATRVHTLSCGSKGITNLQGIQHFKKLQSLTLTGNKVSDITPLKGLPLQNLWMTNTKVSNLTTVGTLKSLKDLSFNNSGVTSIAALKNNKNLVKVSGYNNKITDLTPIAGLTKLTSIEFSNNQISSVYPLRGLTNLTSISLKNNKISNISHLKSLKKTTWVLLDGQNIGSSMTSRVGSTVTIHKIVGPDGKVIAPNAYAKNYNTSTSKYKITSDMLHMKSLGWDKTVTVGKYSKTRFTGTSYPKFTVLKAAQPSISPKVTGAAAAYGKVSVTHAKSSGKVTYAWLLNGSKLYANTASSLTVDPSWVGKDLSVSVIQTRTGYETKTETVKLGKVKALTLTGSHNISMTQNSVNVTAPTAEMPLQITFNYTGPKDKEATKYELLLNNAVVHSLNVSSIPPSYTVHQSFTAADVGKTVAVRITTTKHGYTPVITTKAFGKVAAMPLAPEYKPTISLSSNYGEQNTARPGYTVTTYKNSTTPAVPGQWTKTVWYVDNVNVHQSSQYVVKRADVGKTLTAEVTTTAPNHKPRIERTSRVVLPIQQELVAKDAKWPLSAAVNSTVQVGQTITFNTTRTMEMCETTYVESQKNCTSTNIPVTATIKGWVRNTDGNNWGGTYISGAKSVSYTITEADRGKSVSVMVDYTVDGKPGDSARYGVIHVAE